MSETTLRIRADFEKDGAAKTAFFSLREALEDNHKNLNDSLETVDTIPEEVQQFKIIVSKFFRKRKTLSMQAHSGEIDPPIWLAEPFATLGAYRVNIRHEQNGSTKNYYFVGANKTTKKEFEASEPKKKLTKKDREINANLFLPEGRVAVKAKLIDYVWTEGYYGEFCSMNLETEDGKHIVYRGTSEALTKVTEDDYEDTVEFVAAFERQKIQGEYVALIKRPSKVKVNPK